METHRAALELMKKHAQQQIAVIQGQELNIDEELEEVREQRRQRESNVASALQLRFHGDRVAQSVEPRTQHSMTRGLNPIRKRQNYETFSKSKMLC